MPGTAVFFAPFLKLFGAPAILPIRLAQAILLVVQIGLMAVCARLIFGNRTPALIACCIGAVYPFFLFYQGLLLSETLFHTLLMAGFAALFWWRRRGCRIDIALIVACLCFSAATMTKATLTVLPPLLLGVTAWSAGATWRRSLAVLVVASGVYSAFLSPWWIRNAALFGGFFPFSTSSALNLYLGNNPHNWSTDVERRCSRASMPSRTSWHGSAPSARRRATTSRRSRAPSCARRARNSCVSGTSCRTRPSSARASTSSSAR